MSWLGDSFHSLTGQISNFTKEVLTEGTEEISDHVAELNVSKSQIQELTNQCQVLRQEVERLRRLNVELEEKAEASELQTYSLSSEYRDILQKKEAELNFLKQQSDGQLSSSLYATHVDRDSASTIDSPNQSQIYDFADQSDVLEFGDVIHSHHEINKLADGNHRLHYEADLETSIGSPARKQGEDSRGAEASQDLHVLQERVKELESQLHLEVDQHQCELSALQDIHQQKYGSLKEQYDAEVAQLRENLSVLQRKTGSTSSDGASTDFHQSFLENKAEIERLNDEAKLAAENEKEKLKSIQLLNRQLDQVRSEKANLEIKLQTVQNNYEDCLQKLEDQTKETETLKDRLTSSKDASNQTDQRMTETDDEERKFEALQQSYEETNLQLDKLKATLNELTIVCDNHQSEKLEVERHCEELNTKVENQTERISSLQSENSSLVANLEELDVQHQVAIDQIISSKNLLNEKNLELKKQLDEVESNLESEMKKQNDDSLLNENINRTVEEELHSKPELLEIVNKEVEAENNDKTEFFKCLLCAFENLVRNNETLNKEVQQLNFDASDYKNTIEGQGNELMTLRSEMELLEQQIQDQIEMTNPKDLLESKEENKQLLLKLQGKEDELELLQKSMVDEEISKDFNESEVESLRKVANESREKVDTLMARILILEIENKKLITASEDMEVLKLKEEKLVLSEENEKVVDANKLIRDSESEVVGEDESIHPAFRTSQTSDGSSGGSDFEILNKDDGSDRSSSSKEFVQIESKETDDIGEDLSLLLQQKDDEIKILQEKVLLMSQQLLDCQSPTAEDSPPSFPGSTLEEEVKQLKYEKEQMMAVMNEKMRECSSLKGEVHQLMNVVSAEKQALGKLQLDNEELMKSQKEIGDPELTKETIQKLSRLIRDKDLEMAALSEKNESLLTVLQNQSAPETGEIESLLQQKESLQKQINAYKNDREQILNALNQKHQESLNFHSQLQKVQTMLSEESTKYDNLQLQHKSVAEQFEAKQKSLINTQNELIMLKQKFICLEKDQSELKHQYSSLLSKDKSSENVVQVEKKQWTNKNEECHRLKKLIEDKDKLVSEKDLLILEKSRKIKELEDCVKKKEDEIEVLNVHVELTNTQLKNAQDDFNEAKSQKLACMSSVEHMTIELEMTKEMYGNLAMVFKEKEFEIQSLNSQVSSLNCVLKKESDNNKHEDSEKIVKLLEDNQIVTNQAQTFQQERDQVMFELHQRQQKNKELQNEVLRSNEKEDRLMKELERLRDHLVKVEESYTKEALHAEEREKELRNRLAVAEERVHQSANSYHSVNQQAALRVESLQEQLHMLAIQRDEATMQLSNSESQVQQYEKSLNNLQLVLEQFQQEKNRDIENVKKKCNVSLEEERNKNLEYAKEIELRENKLKEAMEALSAASRLSEQLDRKEQIICSLKDEVNTKEQELQSSMKDVKNFTSNIGAKVDKQVMKNLVLGYFSTPDDKKPEVMRLLASVLDFNQQEVQKVRLVQQNQSKKVGWLSWLSQPGASAQNASSGSTNAQQSSDKNSFSEAFVQFLQKESQPQIQVKLPAEEMAKELTMKAKSSSKEPVHLKPLRINPFTASVSQASPTQKTPSSHLLMKPITTSLPTFTPLPITDSNPSSSSILKDVLREE